MSINCDRCANPDNIIFEINETEKIMFVTAQGLEELDCYCEVPVMFYRGTVGYSLSQEDLKANMDVFQGQLEQVLRGELKMHSSITKHIGHMHNEYLKRSLDEDHKGDLSFICTSEEFSDHWIGTEYQLFGNNEWATWLYNDNDGSIIFEITPVYIEEYERSNGKFFDYNEWIKNYRLHIRRIIPITTAQIWLRQTNLVVADIEDMFYSCKQNYTRPHKIYKQCVRLYGEDTTLKTTWRCFLLKSRNIFMSFFK